MLLNLELAKLDINTYIDPNIPQSYDSIIYKAETLFFLKQINGRNLFIHGDNHEINYNLKEIYDYVYTHSTNNKTIILIEMDINRSLRRHRLNQKSVYQLIPDLLDPKHFDFDYHKNIEKIREKIRKNRGHLLSDNDFFVIDHISNLTGVITFFSDYNLYFSNLNIDLVDIRSDLLRGLS